MSRVLDIVVHGASDTEKCGEVPNSGCEAARLCSVRIFSKPPEPPQAGRRRPRRCRALNGPGSLRGLLGVVHRRAPSSPRLVGDCDAQLLFRVRSRYGRWQRIRATGMPRPVPVHSETRRSTKRWRWGRRSRAWTAIVAAEAHGLPRFVSKGTFG